MNVAKLCSVCSVSGCVVPNECFWCCNCCWRSCSSSKFGAKAEAGVVIDVGDVDVGDVVMGKGKDEDGDEKGETSCADTDADDAGGTCAGMKVCADGSFSLYSLCSCCGSLNVENKRCRSSCSFR